MAYDQIPEKRIFEGHRLVYRNFSGRIDDFNERGDRSFAVVIDDPKLADELENEGWRIKRKPPRDEDSNEFITMKVFVKFDVRPPVIYIVAPNGVRTALTEDTVGQIDSAEILDVKLAVVPYRGKNSRDGKFTAYCKTLYVWIEGDEFEDEFDFTVPDDDVPFD